MKTCPTCGCCKELTEFHKNKSMKDGYQVQCKQCHSINKKAWLQNNQQKNCEYQQRWYKDPEGEASSLSAQKKKKRDALKLRAVPPWFESEKVKKVYRHAKALGFQVDHVVPLQSPNVCGLHCWANLQLLEPSLNSSKGNRYWPDMP